MSPVKPFEPEFSLWEGFNDEFDFFDRYGVFRVSISSCVGFGNLCLSRNGTYLIHPSCCVCWHKGVIFLSVSVVMPPFYS